MKPREKQEEVGAEQEQVRKNKEKFDEMVWDIGGWGRVGECGSIGRGFVHTRQGHRDQ